MLNLYKEQMIVSASLLFIFCHHNHHKIFYLIFSKHIPMGNLCWIHYCISQPSHCNFITSADLYSKTVIRPTFSIPSTLMCGKIFQKSKISFSSLVWQTQLPLSSFFFPLSFALFPLSSSLCLPLSSLFITPSSSLLHPISSILTPHY